MAQLFEIYTCNLCGGNGVEHIHGSGQLACCGEATKQMTKNTTNNVTPGTTSEAVFRIDAETVTAREFFNRHGVWKA